MPVYEYLCTPCDGIFEVVRSMREADEPAPCPVCDTEGQRVMPSTFTAFVMRGGYPRRIPDKGTFWHLGQEVSYLPKKADPNTHPQVTKRRPQEPLGKQDVVDLTDLRIAERRAKREQQRRTRSIANDQRRRAQKELPPALRGQSPDKK